MKLLPPSWKPLEVGLNTAISLSKCSRKLFSLDLSWCRNLTDEALGLVVDSCSSLKLLKLFGCTQITDVFLKGHSNPQVQIIGLKMATLSEFLNVLEPREAPLRMLDTSVKHGYFKKNEESCGEGSAPLGEVFKVSSLRMRLDPFTMEGIVLPPQRAEYGSRRGCLNHT
ncbi:F-box/LRR-repeat protein 4 [Gossypium australe]|uniref:F-box/LRR-repeat protein 4 n=1 Tax=Gossypium australe TaxID=47621 RepID=A0A5B6UMA7_9ROSI|nr:F-box/LRR-repeat protein 4 [Gossypium australe]